MKHETYGYCEDCGSRRKVSDMISLCRDEYGPVYRCYDCHNELDNMEDVPQDEGISDADPGL